MPTHYRRAIVTAAVVAVLIGTSAPLCRAQTPAPASMNALAQKAVGKTVRVTMTDGFHRDGIVTSVAPTGIVMAVEGSSVNKEMMALRRHVIVEIDKSGDRRYAADIQVRDGEMTPLNVSLMSTRG